MTLTARARYQLTTAAILTAGLIQLVRGYRPVIVLIGVTSFLIVGNLIVYISGSKQRALQRQQKRDYYAGNS